jgi:hypothetical protein
MFCGRGIGAVLLSLGDFRASTLSLSVTRGDLGLEDEFELFMQLLGTYFGFATLLALALNWITREILDTGYDVFPSYDEPPSRVGQGRGIIWKRFGGIQGQGVAGDRRRKAIVGGRILADGAEKCQIATRKWQRTKSGRRAGVAPLARRRRARAGKPEQPGQTKKCRRPEGRRRKWRIK